MSGYDASNTTHQVGTGVIWLSPKQLNSHFTHQISQIFITSQMPPSFDLLLGSHIHLGSITIFEDGDDGTRNPPQIVLGNSGTQFVSPSEPPNDVFGLMVKQTEVMYQYGYLVVTRQKGRKEGKSGKRVFVDKTDGSWLLDFKVCRTEMYDQFVSTALFLIFSFTTYVRMKWGAI